MSEDVLDELRLCAREYNVRGLGIKPAQFGLGFLRLFLENAYFLLHIPRSFNMHIRTLLFLYTISVTARPQTANPRGSGDNGEMGGIFGMGVRTTLPAWASGIGSAFLSFASSSGLSTALSSLTNSIDTNALIDRIVPSGLNTRKAK